MKTRFSAVAGFESLAFGALLVGALALSACDKGSPEGQADEQPQAAAAPAAAPAVAKNPASEAKKVFKSNCVVCHGDSGAGDGPGAAALDPKPRDFSDAKNSGPDSKPIVYTNSDRPRM